MGEEDQIVVELRSDTFTKPSKKMLEEMINAEVGDSVYDEDPTVIKLENKIADLFGKEASLFMPTGTMANLAAIMSHCYERGREIIIGDKSHINLWEQGTISQLGGVYVKQIANFDDGTFDLEKLENIIPDHSDRCCPKTEVICIENSQNWCGGRILPLDFLEKLKHICNKRDIKLHLDGSRIMNVSVATNTDLRTLCKHADSINFCFSKGLGAPVGSILIGEINFIKRALRIRQSLGGGMRQVGVLAAAALYGLSQANENLRKDNENAKRLAEGIKQIKQNIFVIDNVVETNIVHLKILKNDLSVPELINRLATVKNEELKELKRSISVKVGEVDKKSVRLLTHLDVDRNKIDLALKKIEYVAHEYSNLN